MQPSKIIFAIMEKVKLDILRTLKQRKLTMKEVADRMGLTPPAIKQAIDGNPTTGKIMLIADAIGCDVRDLFYSPDDEERSQSAPAVEQHFVCPRCGTRFAILPPDDSETDWQNVPKVKAHR